MGIFISQSQFADTDLSFGRTVALPTTTSYTIMLWYEARAAALVPGFRALVWLHQDEINWHQIEILSGSPYRLNLARSGLNTGNDNEANRPLTSGNIATGWNHITLTANSTIVRGIVQEPDGTILFNSAPVTTFTPNFLRFGGCTFDENANGSIAGIKAWNAPLSDDEIALERTSLSPVRTANLIAWVPANSDSIKDSLVDYSGTADFRILTNRTILTLPTIADNPPVSWDPNVLEVNQLSYENYKLGPRYETNSGSGSSTAVVKLPAFRAGEEQLISLSFRGIGSISAPAGWNVINNTVNGSVRVITFNRLANIASPGNNTVSITLPVASDWVAHSVSYAGRIKSNTLLVASSNNTGLYSYIPTVSANAGDYVIGTITNATSVGKSYKEVLASRLSGRDLVARHFFDEQLSGNSTPFIKDYSVNNHDLTDVFFGNIISYNTISTDNTALRSTTLGTKYFARRTLFTGDPFFKFASNRKWTSEVVVDKSMIGVSGFSRIFVLHNRLYEYASLYGIGISDTQYIFYSPEGSTFTPGEGGEIVANAITRSTINALGTDKAVIHYVLDTTTPVARYTTPTSTTLTSAGFFVSFAPSGATAPTFISQVSSNMNVSFGLTINKPANTQAGDILIAVILTNDSERNPIGPPGWIPIKSGSTKITYIGNYNSPDLGCWVWYKVLGASEPSSYLFDSDNSLNGFYFMACYRGAAAPPVVGEHIFTRKSSSSTNTPIKANSIKTTSANSLVLLVSGIISGSTTTPRTFSFPSQFTSRVSVSNEGAALSLADTIITAPNYSVHGSRERIYINGVPKPFKTISNATQNFSITYTSNTDIITFNRGSSDINYREGGYNVTFNSMERTPVGNLYYAALYADSLDLDEVKNNANILLVSTNSSAENITVPAPVNLVTNGLVLNYEAANFTSYSGTGNVWVNAVNPSAGPNLIIFGNTTFVDSTEKYFSFGTNQITDQQIATADYMLLGPTNSIPADDHTVEIWFKSRASSTVQCALHYGLGNGLSNNVLTVGLTNPTQLFFDSFGTEYTFNIPAENANRWLYVSKTRNKTTGVETVYLNGVQIGTFTRNAGVSVFTGGYLVLGQEVDGHTGSPQSTFDTIQNLDGEIRTVRFYDRVLTAQEIAQNYAAANYRAFNPNTLAPPITPSYLLVNNISRNSSGTQGVGSALVSRYINNVPSVTQQAITFNQKIGSFVENGVDYIARTFTTAPAEGSTVVVTISFAKLSGTTPSDINNLELFDNQGNHYKSFSCSTNDRSKAQYIFVSHNVKTAQPFTIYMRDTFDASIRNYISWGAASFNNVQAVGAYSFNSLVGTGANASVSITPTTANSTILAVASVFLRPTLNANITTPTNLTNLHKAFVSPFDQDASYIILNNDSSTRNIQWNHRPLEAGTSNVWIAQAIELRPNIAGTFDDATGFLSSNSISNFSTADGYISSAFVIEPVVEMKGLYVNTSNNLVKYAQVTEKTAKSGKLIKIQSGSITTLTSNTDTGFYTNTSLGLPLVFDNGNVRTLNINKEIVIR